MFGCLHIDEVEIDGVGAAPDDVGPVETTDCVELFGLGAGVLYWRIYLFITLILRNRNF